MGPGTNKNSPYVAVSPPSISSIWDWITRGNANVTPSVTQPSSAAAPPVAIAQLPTPAQAPLPISAVATEAVNSGANAATQAKNEQSQQIGRAHV